MPIREVAFEPVGGTERQRVGKQLRALVVDDHDDVRTMLRRVLEMLGADVVAEAASGEVALDVIRSHEVDLVVMDIYMPGIGGVEATRLLKQAYPDVTVFGFTAWGEAEANEMLSAGATAVFEKTDTATLVAAIKHLAGESNG